MDKRKEIVKYRFSDPQRAYDICTELLEQGIVSGNDYEIAYAYLYMGDTLFSMGKMEEALEYMTMAENVQKQNGFDSLLMKTYNIVGIIYGTMGDALLSIDYYHEAFKIASKYDNYTLEAMIYNNMGSLLANVGDISKSTEYYKLAYDYSLKKGMDDSELKFSMLQLHINICGDYFEEGRYAEAKAYLDDVVRQVGRDNISGMYQMRVLRMYAKIYYKMNDFAKAYDMCLKITEMDNLDWYDVEVFDDYRDIAEIMISMDHIARVKSLIDYLSSMAEKNDIDSRRLKVCELYIKMYLKTGEKDKLNGQYKRYYELKRRINQERNKIIISAIDNRCRLETERKKNKRLNDDNMKLVKESEMDELTGLYNRFALKRRYDKLYKYALKNHHTYCVGIFDIDFFKQYNDLYGHLQGDECLKLVARIFRETSDGDFCVARYGGDEFVFMAYDVDEEQVRNFAGRLVAAIRSADICFENPLSVGHVTISAGAVIQDTVEGMELTTLIKEADTVLYEVKQAGKNGYKICVQK